VNEVVRIKRNDQVRGIDGFGKRGRPATYLECVLINMPLIMEVIDGESKLIVEESNICSVLFAVSKTVYQAQPDNSDCSKTN
jgi:PII-like signaling protein